MSNSEKKSLGVVELLIIGGFTAFFCWYLLFLVGFPQNMPESATELQRRVIQLFGLLGLLAGYGVAMRFPRSFQENAYGLGRIILWGIVAALVPAMVLLDHLGFVVPFLVMLVCYVAAGFAATYFYIGWENLAARGKVSDIIALAGSVMTAGMVLFLIFALSMPLLAQVIMSFVLLAIGAALMHYVNVQRVSREAAPRKGKKGRDEIWDELDEEDQEKIRHTFNFKLSCLFLIENLPLGFALALLYSTSQLCFFLALGVAALVLLVYTVFGRYASKLTFTMLLRISIGISSVALLLLAAFDATFSASVFMLIAVWFVTRLAHNGTLLKLTGIQRIAPVFFMARGKMPGTAGFVLGFILGIPIVALGYPAEGIRITALVLIAILLLGTLVFMPVSENYSQQLSKAPFEKPVVADMSSEESERERCAALAKRFGLSPREEEVLFYILKGRNAKFIAEKLVISESTSKTHIHNIYKKSGVHSQQKFIDLLEELKD